MTDLLTRIEIDKDALEAAWLAHDNACPGEHWKKSERMESAIRAYLTALPAPVVDWRKKKFVPIEMPLTAEGQGPASVEKGEARKITYEVWDAANCDTHGSFDHLLDAVNEAERLNASLTEGKEPK